MCFTSVYIGVPVYTRVKFLVYLSIVIKDIIICLNCGEEIRVGRSDRKFCSTACKDEYHNALKLTNSKEMRKINLTLKKNRSILAEYFRAYSETKVHRDELLQKGFNFKYYTHHVTSKIKGNVFTFCYEFGYRELEDSHCHIIKKFGKNNES